ncbi:MAG: circularly permuted type 2 ATP-grasp protein [Pseudomonadota bacterium]
MTISSKRQSPMTRGYRGHRDVYDEMVSPTGEVRAHWRTFFDMFSSMSASERAQMRASAQRLLAANHVTYAVADEEPRPWRLDVLPMILDSREWDVLQSGLVQRARLLNAVVGDLYGAQTLLRSGQLPPAVVFGNRDFLLPCHGYQAPDGAYLDLLAFDLARGVDGAWRVVSQRTETPAGLGYALENRIVSSRSLSEPFSAHRVHRLAHFFHDFQEYLQTVGRREENLAVILAGGGDHQDAFEHAFLGRYLGYPLVEGVDLTVRGGRVYLKTLDGLKRVDLVLRRVVSEDTDPLELRANSLLGIPGLLRAAHDGQVIVSNAIGSGVAESEALMAYLPELATTLLDEPLTLPSIDTWWCGQPQGLAHVLENLDTVALRHAFGHRSMLTEELSQHVDSNVVATDLDTLRERIRQSPDLFIGRERLRPSTMPVWSDHGELVPQPMLLRLFVARTAAGYSVMPGGLVKTLDEDGVSCSKDVWVGTKGPIDTFSLLPQRGARLALRRSDRALPSKTGDDIFWLGRYFERAEGAVRLYRSLFAHLAGESTLVPSPVAHNILTGLLVAQNRLSPRRARRAAAGGATGVERELWNILFDPDSPDGLSAILGNVRRTAESVRERLSQDSWRIVQALSEVPQLRWQVHTIADAQDVLANLIDKQSALNGFIQENMTRGYGWRLLDIGRRIERLIYLGNLLGELVKSDERDEEGVQTLLLELADSQMTYRARYQAAPEVAATLDLLIADPTNPRSIAFQLHELERHLNQMPLEPRDGLHSQAQRLHMKLLADVNLADMNQLATTRSATGRRQALGRLLRKLDRGANELTAELSRKYFSHSSGRLVAGVTSAGTNGRP